MLVSPLGILQNIDMLGNVEFLFVLFFVLFFLQQATIVKNNYIMRLV